jgi:hypothetical protein
MCVCSFVFPFFLLSVCPCLPFYSFEGEGSGYIRGKKDEMGKRRKRKKGGLGCVRLSPYPVGAVSPRAQRCNMR